MKKFSKRIIIALCALLLISVVALGGCGQSNASALPPSDEQTNTGEENNGQIDSGEEDNGQGDADEENKDEQDNSEENPEDEGKPSLPGGLVDGGEFSGENT